eukprot:3924522-Pyramimonas_sp.AAC.1
MQRTLPWTPPVFTPIAPSAARAASVQTVLAFPRDPQRTTTGPPLCSVGIASDDEAPAAGEPRAHQTTALAGAAAAAAAAT